MEKIYIYALCEPNSQVIRYVGQTNNTNKRYAKHIRPYKSDKTYKDNWIRKLAKNGEVPELIILEETDRELANIIEGYWIEQCLAWGFKLTNLTREGNVKEMLPEVKLKMKEAWNNESRKQSMSEQAKERWNDPELRNKMTNHAKLKGRKVSDKTKEKMKAAQTNKPGKSIKAINIETGEVLTFVSLKIMVRELNLNENRVYDTLKGYSTKYDRGEARQTKVSHHKGYTFEREMELI